MDNCLRIYQRKNDSIICPKFLKDTGTNSYISIYRSTLNFGQNDVVPNRIRGRQGQMRLKMRQMRLKMRLMRQKVRLMRLKARLI